MTVDSRESTPVILLADPKADFEIIAVAESTNGRNAELTFSVDYSGNYVLIVTSAEPDETGRFRITLAAA